MKEEPDYYKEWMANQVKVRRLLLIDDSMEDCILIQRYTYPYHCEWAMANNLENAQYCLKNMSHLGGFSLIFLDLNLGQNSTHGGIAAFKTIKEEYPQIPVVILSGYLSTDAIASVTRAGFAMFAQKPDSFSDKYFEELFRIMSIPRRPGLMVDHLESP